MFNKNREEVRLKIEKYKKSIKKLTAELQEYAKEQKIMYISLYPTEDSDVSFQLRNEVLISLEEIFAIQEAKNEIDYELINDFLIYDIEDCASEEDENLYSFGCSNGGWESSYE